MKTTIKDQYEHYLILMDLKEEEMSEEQRVETKRAFYGGFGHLLKILETIGNEPEIEGVESESVNLLQDLFNEMTEFVNDGMDEKEEFSEEFMEAFMSWVRNVKGITAIDMEELVGMLPEYEEYIERTKS